MHIAITKTK